MKEEYEGEAPDDDKEDTDVSGYESDDDNPGLLNNPDVDDTASEAGSVAPFSWKDVGKNRRTVPLAQVQVWPTETCSHTLSLSVSISWTREG